MDGWMNGWMMDEWTDGNYIALSLSSEQKITEIINRKHVREVVVADLKY
jgi:hypothetical protein